MNVGFCEFDLNKILILWRLATPKYPRILRLSENMASCAYFGSNSRNELLLLFSLNCDPNPVGLFFFSSVHFKHTWLCRINV